jgi:hypothetical protein
MASVAIWSSRDRLEEMIRRSPDYMPGSVGAQFREMVTPVNLGIMAGTLAVWAGSHFFGVGEIVDVGLLLVGAFTVGAGLGSAANRLYEGVTTALGAQTDEDLDRAARAFADAVVQAGVSTVLALLLRKSAVEMQASRGATLKEVVRLRSKPGLADVGPDAQAGRWWRKPSLTRDPAMTPGEGSTSAFGDITVSARGTATEQQLALFHEQVHSALSPRFILLRTFRARLNMSAYMRSALLQYLEEAMAETYAQLRVNGVGGLWEGIRFPVANGYMTIQDLASEGAQIGTILVGTQRFSVQFVPGPPSSDGANMCQ